MGNTLINSIKRNTKSNATNLKPFFPFGTLKIIYLFSNFMKNLIYMSFNGDINDFNCKTPILDRNIIHYEIHLKNI